MGMNFELDAFLAVFLMSYFGGCFGPVPNQEELLGFLGLESQWRIWSPTVGGDVSWVLQHYLLWPTNIKIFVFVGAMAQHHIFDPVQFWSNCHMSICQFSKPLTSSATGREDGASCRTLTILWRGHAGTGLLDWEELEMILWTLNLVIYIMIYNM